MTLAASASAVRASVLPRIADWSCLATSEALSSQPGQPGAALPVPIACAKTCACSGVNVEPPTILSGRGGM